MRSDVRQAVILAGGRGTRLGHLTALLPKPMITIHGRPFIHYLVEMLQEQGIRRILLLLGYRAEPIVQYFGDGSDFGIEIAYAISSPEDETGTRLRNVVNRVDARFLLTYCDNYWPMRLDEMCAAYEAATCPAMLTVYRNHDNYTRDNVRIASGRVTIYDKSRTAAGLRGVDIGFGIFERSVLEAIPTGGNPSFETTVYPRLVAEGNMAAFETDHRYYSIGSLERLPLTEEFLRRRKTILVDRDGTLNVRMPKAQYVTSWDHWQWIPGSLDSLVALSSAGYRIVVVTNQPGVARGALTQEQLDAIHERMISDAEEAGANIDAVLACTHGWDEGCDCRKPRPGLLFEAQRRFSLDLTRTPFIGDDERDEHAARAASAPFLPVTDSTPLASVVGRLLKGDISLASAS